MMLVFGHHVRRLGDAVSARPSQSMAGYRECHELCVSGPVGNIDRGRTDPFRGRGDRKQQGADSKPFQQEGYDLVGCLATYHNRQWSESPTPTQPLPSFLTWIPPCGNTLISLPYWTSVDRLNEICRNPLRIVLVAGPCRVTRRRSGYRGRASMDRDALPRIRPARATPRPEPRQALAPGRSTPFRQFRQKASGSETSCSDRPRARERRRRSSTYRACSGSIRGTPG